MARVALTITIHTSELIYDVENKTYLTGRSRGNGQNHEEVANMQASSDDENRNQILRSFGNALGVLRNKLAEYLSLTATTSSDVLLSESSPISIALSMPSNYNKNTIDAITAALHMFFVNTAVADWFTITNKADAADYVTQSAANLETLREALNKRVRPTYAAPNND